MILETNVFSAVSAHSRVCARENVRVSVCVCAQSRGWEPPHTQSDSRWLDRVSCLACLKSFSFVFFYELLELHHLFFLFSGKKSPALTASASFKFFSRAASVNMILCFFFQSDLNTAWTERHRRKRKQRKKEKKKTNRGCSHGDMHVWGIKIKWSQIKTPAATIQSRQLRILSAMQARRAATAGQPERSYGHSLCKVWSSYWTASWTQEVLWTFTEEVKIQAGFVDFSSLSQAYTQVYPCVLLTQKPWCDRRSLVQMVFWRRSWAAFSNNFELKSGH